MASGAVDPDEDADRARDVKRRIKDREHVGKLRDALAEVLHGVLAEDAEPLLEAHDLPRVLARGRDVDVPHAA